MPWIVFEAGQLSTEVKAELIKELTETSSRVTGIPKEFFFVSIHELPDENIAVGGKTVKEHKAILAARTNHSDAPLP